MVWGLYVTTQEWKEEKTRNEMKTAITWGLARIPIKRGRKYVDKGIVEVVLGLERDIRKLTETC